MNGALKVIVWLVAYVSACMLAFVLGYHVGPWWGIGFGLVASFGMGMLALYGAPRSGRRPPALHEEEDESERVVDASDMDGPRPMPHGIWDPEHGYMYWRD